MNKYIAKRDITNYHGDEYFFKKGKVYEGEMSDDILWLIGENGEEYDYQCYEIEDRFTEIKS